MKLATSIAILVLFDSAQAVRMKDDKVMAQIRDEHVIDTAHKAEADDAPPANLEELEKKVDEQTETLENLGAEGDQFLPRRCNICDLKKKTRKRVKKCRESSSSEESSESSTTESDSTSTERSTTTEPTS